MKRLSLIIACLAVTGCNKMLPIPLGNSVQGTRASTAKTFLIMGQSNAVRFGQYGGPDAFTRAVQSFAPGAITWIQCSVGGTSIDQWQKGNGTLYQACLALAKDKRIDGIIWDQGEYEAEQGDSYTALVWASKFTDLMTTFRQDISNPSAVVLYARLGPAHGLPMADTLRQAQESVHLPYSHMANLDDVAVPQGLHYDPSAYPLLAEDFARAYYDLLQGE